jgi:hypothetical protein
MSRRIYKKICLVSYLDGEAGPAAEPAVSGMRGASGRLPLWSLHMRGMQVFLWQNLQQPVRHTGVQE